ncbi:MAG: hypothetical protein RM347_021035 [Nostoc sp. ChiQUE02]|uniref:hypothetical protein n=1 Tax=Nostoc sp. ChiQUE02 TaxID=3075377 RepID=UPI002AD2030A|nr:hypothetical protein [Nostoc sp. ChiQUE02]MDZ8233328.1 hypothetical protein [Nostoc sp. ChiQUE02]
MNYFETDFSTFIVELFGMGADGLQMFLTKSVHVRQITCDMSLRVQRSGTFAQRLVEKQSQGFWDCFTSFAMTII